MSSKVEILKCLKFIIGDKSYLVEHRAEGKIEISSLNHKEPLELELVWLVIYQGYTTYFLNHNVNHGHDVELIIKTMTEYTNGLLVDLRS